MPRYPKEYTYKEWIKKFRPSGFTKHTFTDGQETIQIEVPEIYCDTCGEEIKPETPQGLETKILMIAKTIILCHNCAVKFKLSGK